MHQVKRWYRDNSQHREESPNKRKLAVKTAGGLDLETGEGWTWK